jgi:hypothetical protein
MRGRRTTIPTVRTLFLIACAAALATGVNAQRPVTLTYFIADGAPGSGYLPSDRELALWALEAWTRNMEGSIRLEPTPEASALVRVYWVPANGDTYGETRPIEVNGRRGGAIYVRPDVSALGPEFAARAAADRLWRETIVYLTCLHELGHALGLSHTADERDVMYYFGYGGDIVEFFARYRRQLGNRSDIQLASGLSPSDIRLLRAAPPP